MASRLCNDDLTHLIYRFDAENPWKHFTGGAPHKSSVEIGPRKMNFKFQKIYVRKNGKSTRRKNGAYSEIATMNPVCCDGGCLLKVGISASRQVMREERGKVFARKYNEQNYIFSKLIDIEVSPSGRRTIRYRIPSLGVVCKTAFLKCYGISQRKINVLLKKIDPSGVLVEPDKRGQHCNRTRKLMPEARKHVIDYITSHDASESHYRGSRSRKKYFDSVISMRQMWLEFVKKFPEFKTNHSRLKNKGPVISYSCFRNIFNKDLREILSFRKPRIDTCQFCDRNKKQIDHSRDEAQLQELLIQKRTHLRESEVRFASLKYDMEVLATKPTRTET